MNDRTTGLGGMIAFVVAATAVVIALFPAGFQHQVRHQWREKECAERLRTLQQLAAVRQSMGPSRASLPPGGARWLSIQRAFVPIVGTGDLHLFFCPYQVSDIATGATDFRGPAKWARGWGGWEAVGADKEDNHPPCCPLNVVQNDGSVKPCPFSHPWKLKLRDELRP